MQLLLVSSSGYYSVWLPPVMTITVTWLWQVCLSRAIHWQ